MPDFKVRRNTAEGRLDDAVREVGQRDLARRPGHDPSVVTRRVDPATLSGCLCRGPRGVVGGVCGRCGREAA